MLAIPDSLDEFGQEMLLRDLKICGFENIQFLWRPVAAALSWLSKLNPKNVFTENTSVKEHIMVVYLGPDGVEMTTFRLHREEHDNTLFIIPVRERPGHVSSVAGFDWAANALEKTYPGIDDGAFWQAFTKFPHVWEALSGRSFSSNVDVWSLEDRWTFWAPDERLVECAGSVPAAPNSRLRALLENSCRLFSVVSEKEETPAAEALAKLFISVLDSRPQSRLRGIIVSGPLCPPRLPIWIQSAEDKLQAFGIKANTTSPQLDTIWLAHEENPVIDGCAEYGRRLDRGLPTYLDTLPQLSVLAEQQGDHIWVDLLNAETCQGGKPYKPAAIRGKFAIQAGAQHLQVFLKKGGIRGRIDLEAPESLEGQETRLPQSSRSEIIAKVRQAGTYEEVLKSFANKEMETLEYARKLARELFGNPFRRAEFAFPSVPEANMPVDISLEIRPASGLAQITLVPSFSEDAAFLRGRQIFLDYSTMAEADPPPPPTRGWPDVITLKVDPTASFLLHFKYEIKKYLKTTPLTPDFMSIVDGVKNALTRFTNNPTDEGFEHLRPIDQDGKAGNQEASMVIDRLADKAEKDFVDISPANKMGFVVRMSWLFAKTPNRVVQQIRTYISQNLYNQKWNYGVDAGGRVFTAEEDFRLLYEKIYKRIKSNHNKPFPIQSSRALWRSLSLRDKSPRAMARTQAKTFTEEAVKILEQESDLGNFERSFFQAARLFLFLLRFRVVDHDFLDPSNPMDSDLFERALKCLKAAENHFSHSQATGAVRAKELVIGIEKFMRYEGSNDILTALDELAG
ncbi:hypothetical protein B2D07_02020 [Desulfococcus multivorans]|nr:hypothetical protein B2D07_02020 [Desulfococcus multivorans]SKA25746.1 hypothetical protein SAMN02745446_03572 [Desulfococcus multivorans DSM 2059]